MLVTTEREEQLAVVVQEVEGVTAQVRALEIRDQISMDIAVSLRDGLGNFIRMLKSLLDPPVEEAHALHKSAIRRRDEYLAGPELTLAMIKKKILTAVREEEERKRKAEQEAREKTRRSALREKMIEAGKGDDWLAFLCDVREGHRIGEPGNLVATLPLSEIERAIVFLEEEETIAAAEKMEEKGMAQAADILISSPPAPTPAPIPPVEVRFEKPKGAGSRTVWTAKVDNKSALVEAVARRVVSIEALDANEPFLNGLARMMKEGFVVPGCHAEKREVPN